MVGDRRAALILLLILCVVLVAFPNVGIVRAEGTIYIRADGSVEGTDKIQRDGDVYTFTGNIYGSIVVERYNIVIDGGGYILEGTGAAIDGPARNIGIDLAWMRNVTIRNVCITSFDYGIRISGAFNNAITGNDIKNNGYGIEVILNSSGNSIYENNITANIKGGIWIDFANGNTISSNQITNNKPKGIWIYSSSNEILSENYVANNSYGIVIDRSSHTTLRNNTMIDNEQTFSVEGTGSDHFVNDIDVLNTVDGKPIYYWVNQHGKTVLSDAGYVALVNCTNITVQTLNLSGNGQGILLASTTNSTITKTTITNTNDGVYLHSSSNNSIIENYLTNNGQGISFSSSCDNIISGNHVTNNWCSIRLGGSSNNTISTNNIKNNSCAIIFEYSSTNNSVNRNLIENNTCCISFLESSNNIFFHNTFLNNTEHVTDLGTSAYWLAPSINIWDDGKEGNYWSDYIGTDSNGDGIGDTPYIIDESNQDNFPLMKQIPQRYTPKEQPEPFPAQWVTITIVIIAVIGAAFLIYFLKIKKTTRPK
jgi:parallel beta-helix repeat protein